MKHLLVLIVLIAAVFLVACGGEDTGFSGNLNQGSSPKEIAGSVVIEEIEIGIVPVKLDTIKVEEITNDGTYATIRITALRRPSTASPWVEQYREVTLVDPTGNGWNVQHTTGWYYTESQEAVFQATEEAAAQATSIAAEQDRLDALELVSVEILQTSGIAYTDFRGGAPLPVTVYNLHDEPHEVTFRLTFLFPGGEVFPFTDLSRRVDAYTNQEFILRGVIRGGTPEKYVYRWNPITGEPINPAPIVSLVEYQILVDGDAKEIVIIGE